jgi:hypothetical protein
MLLSVNMLTTVLAPLNVVDLAVEKILQQALLMLNIPNGQAKPKIGLVQQVLMKEDVDQALSVVIGLKLFGKTLPVLVALKFVVTKTLHLELLSHLGLFWFAIMLNLETIEALLLLNNALAAPDHLFLLPQPQFQLLQLQSQLLQPQSLEHQPLFQLHQPQYQ